MPFAIGRAIQDGIVEGDNSALAALGARPPRPRRDPGRRRRDAAPERRLQLAPGNLPPLAARRAPRRPQPAPRSAGGSRRARSSPPSRTTRCGPAARTTSPRGSSGAIVSYVVVAVILLSSSVVLGLLVLLGVPVLVLLLGTVIRPLQARQRDQRHEVGRLTALGADTAAGLRVLRGIGGEQAFFDRYRESSQQVRIAGVRVALPQSTLDAAQVFLPGVFVVLVTWIGARFALSGRIERRRARGLLRLRRVPRHPAAHRRRGGGQGDARARRRAANAGRARRRAHGRQTRRRPSPSRRPASALADARLRARRRARAAHVRRLGEPARVSGARGPARPLRRRPPASRSAASPPRPAARRRAPAHRRRRGRTRCCSPARSGRCSTRGERADRRRRSSPRCRSPSAEDVLEALPRRARRARRRARRARSPAASASGSRSSARLLADAGDPHPRRADERGRRAHRGADRGAAARRRAPARTTVVVTASPLVLDRADAVAFLEDGRVNADRRAPRAPAREPGLPAHRHPWRGGGRGVIERLPVAGAARTLRSMRGCSRAATARALAVDGRPARAPPPSAGLAAPLLLGELVQSVTDGTTTRVRRPDRARPRRVPARPDRR